jgi:hypothetical protein
MGLDSNTILDTFFEKLNVTLKAKSCDVGLSPAKLRGFAHINARDGQIQNPTMNHGKE